MRFSSAFIIAACAVLFSTTEAIPMRNGQEANGHHSGRADPPVPVVQPLHDQLSRLTLGQSAARRAARRPPPVQPSPEGWYQNLAQPRPGRTNEYGSPIASPEHAHAHGQEYAARPSGGHYSEAYASSAPHHESSSSESPSTPRYIVAPLDVNHPSLHGVNIEDIPDALEHPRYKKKGGK